MVETFEFEVQGSAAEPYKVRFVIDQGRAIATCTCAAGLARQLCKHRLQILRGDLEACIAADPAIASDLHAAVSGSPLYAALTALEAAEAQAGAARAAETDARRALARIMAG